MNMLAANSPYWEEASFCKVVKFYGLQVEVIGTYSFVGRHLGGIDIDSVTVDGVVPVVDLSEMVAQSNLIDELEKIIREEMDVEIVHSVHLTKISRGRRYRP